MTLENFSFIDVSQPAARRSRQAKVVWGSRVVTVGGDAPVRVQSMTNTDTVDVIGTAIQVKELALAGSEMVRIRSTRLRPLLPYPTFASNSIAWASTCLWLVIFTTTATDS